MENMNPFNQHNHHHHHPMEDQTGYCTSDNMQDLLTSVPSSVMMSTTPTNVTKFMSQQHHHHPNTIMTQPQPPPFHPHPHHDASNTTPTTNTTMTTMTDPSSIMESMYYTTQPPPAPLQISYEEPPHQHSHQEEKHPQESFLPSSSSMKEPEQQHQQFDTTPDITTTAVINTTTTTNTGTTATPTMMTPPPPQQQQQHEEEEEGLSPQPEKSSTRKQQETSSASLPSHNMRWTNEEDELLLTGLLEHGYGKWKAISEHVKTRNPLQCKNHARHWLLTDKMDENVRNQPTVNKPTGSEEDKTSQKQQQHNLDEETLTNSMMMMETCQPPPSPQPGPFVFPPQQPITTNTTDEIIPPSSITTTTNDTTLALENTTHIAPKDTTVVNTTMIDNNDISNTNNNNNTTYTNSECKHFDRNTITDDEKKNNPEWFCDSKSNAKSPERYMKIRNHILDSWHQVYKPRYMTKTAARKSLKDCGDVNAIGRVHAYLENVGAINVGCVTTTKPRAPATRRAAVPSSSSSRRGYFYYEETDDEDDSNETSQKRKSRPDDDYDGRSGGSKGNGRNRPRPKRVTKKPQHYYDEDSTRDTDDPFCLVPVEDYVDVDPPFHVDIASNALLMMDFHSHLSYTEIIGLLGGRYVHEDRKLHVECVFPCLGTSSTDIECEMDPESEMRAREVFANKGLSVVGWYHSHPTFEPNPSVRDIEYQQLYQTLFRDETTGIEPFIGIIVNPSFAFEGDVSRIQYVHIEHHQKNQGIPFACPITILPDNVLSSEVIEQMTSLVHQFKGSDNNTDFDARMDKVIASLRANLPTVTEQMMDLLQNLRALMHEDDQPTADGPSSSGPVSVM